MASSAVHSQVQENDEQHPHHVDSQQVTHGAEEEQHPEHIEKMSIMNKVKAKARRMKDSIKKHGQHVLDYGGSNNGSSKNEHTPAVDDHDSDIEDDNETVLQDPRVHEPPPYESESKVVKGATIAPQPSENLDKSGVDLQGTKVAGEEPHYDPLVEGDSSTTEINQNTPTHQAKTFSAQDKVSEEDHREEDHRRKINQNTPTQSEYPQETESTDIKSATLESEQVENSGKSGIDFESTKFMTEEPHHNEGVSPTTEINQNIVMDPIKTFAAEEKLEQGKVNWEKPIPLDEDPHEQGSSIPEAYALPNYQTKVTDPSRTGSDEIKHITQFEDITQFEESFKRKNVHDEPKPTTEPKIQSTVVDTEYPPAEKSHDHLVPHLSDASKTHNEYPQEEKVSTDINRNLEIPSAKEETFNTITTADEKKPQYESVETQQKHKSYTDEIEIPDAAVDETLSTEIGEASKLGYDEKGDRNDERSDEIKDITPVEESFERMNIHDEQKSTTEPETQSTAASTEYPPAERSHDQFVPHLSAATETRNEYPHEETESTNINRNPEIPSAKEETFNTISTTTDEKQPQDYESVETQPKHKSYTDEIESSDATADETFSPEIDEASKLGYNEKGESGNASNNAHSLTDNLAPVYGKDAEVGSAEKSESEVYGTSTGNGDGGVETETKNGVKDHEKEVSMKDYLAEKPRPGAKEETFNTISTTTDEKQPQDYESVETQPKHKSYTDEIESSDATADETFSPEIDEASKLGYNEKGESGNASNNAHSLTDNLAPVYGKDAEVGSAEKSESEVYGTSTGNGDGGVETETKNGVKDHEKEVSMKDYLAEKPRPGEEDKALSEVISESLRKPKEEPVKKEDGELGNRDGKSEKVGEESHVNTPEKGMVGKVMGVVGSWFSKSEENQSPPHAVADERFIKE